ncbi:hypothetical protein AB0P21_10120 [Kribbella sp. NPDC056861]|uniref:hypothetical protein n=1 Tax=Kribbella sp. NPDC056861 TaxID=3154857 RepID=UPI00341AA95E
MSPLANALLINGVVLFSVLEADLGPHRKIGKFRILRPLLTAGLIIPFYLKGLTTDGAGLALELGLTAAGLLLGALAINYTRVYRSPRTGKPVSAAGWGYAAIWVGVVAVRSLFSYGSSNWFGPQLGTWMATHHVTTNALTDALMMMAVAMMLVRTGSFAARASMINRSHREASAPALV